MASARKLEHVKTRRLDIDLWFEEYKASLRCQSCGESHPACLQFHHRDPAEKDFAISAMRRGSFARLKAEIEKCDVLCANCHAKLHWHERRADVPPITPPPPLIDHTHSHRPGSSGERHNKARLTATQVAEIRRRYRASQTSCAVLAAEYGVSTSNINQIVNRKIWTCVAPDVPALPTYNYREPERQGNIKRQNQGLTVAQ